MVYSLNWSFLFQILTDNLKILLDIIIASEAMKDFNIKC